MIASFIKRMLPRSLLGRSLMIIVTPVVLLQVVSAFVFYESHWDKVTLRLARNIAGDVAAIVSVMRDQGDIVLAEEIASSHMDMHVSFEPNEILPNVERAQHGMVEQSLAQALREYVGRPFRIDAESLDRDIAIWVQLNDGVLQVTTTRKRLFSSTTYVVVLWTLGSALILFGVAIVFMRNQVKPIRRLALAADNLGKGRVVEAFKAEGATEVRQAAAAFLAMRDRLSRQVQQRTDMLSGVSHDLRTPLTRMKLQLALLGEQPGIDDLHRDIADMERMLDGYLAFARGEGGETPRPVDLAELLRETVDRARNDGAAIDLHIEGSLDLPLRPDAFKRALTNLIANAARYARHIAVRAGRRGNAVEIVIDDDGPGIPEARRDDVFKPFFRLDASRNPGTGGVGLGLTIARDVVRGHGGDLVLADSPLGGLRVRATVPV
jgi:two-component system osmolarity sensor histidine kinase EnvZ